MTIALVAALGVIGQLILASVLHALVRRQARERNKLIGQICLLADRQPGLAADKPRPEVEPDPDLGRYMFAPEQLPDDYS